MVHFECHVTLKPEKRELVEALAKKHKFKVSSLVGDEVMGDDKLLYCTTHDADFQRISDRTTNLLYDLRYENLTVLRKKIEQILVDERY